MKVIFLDIDGVLQPIGRINRIRCDYDEVVEEVVEKLQDESYYNVSKFDIAAVYLDWEKEAIDNLKKLIEKTHAKIVLSTGWRYMGYENLLKLFHIHGLDQYIVDQTPRYEDIEDPDQYDVELDEGMFHFTYMRVIEILEYVRVNDIDNYVALDDMNLFQLENHYVHVDSGYFNKDNYKEALKILNSK